MEHFSVTNLGEDAVHGRYHGVDYDWAVGETLTIDEGAAAHLFGMGLPDPARAFHGLGWLAGGRTMADAKKRLAQMKFEPVEQVFQVSEGRRKRSKTIGTGGSSRPPSAAVGSEGELVSPDESDDAAA